MEQGEGATSMGAMVPLVELSDLAQAQATLRTLEEHAILAIMDGEVGSPAVPKSPSGRPRVWVPSTMFQEAQVILREHALEIMAVRSTSALSQGVGAPLVEVEEPEYEVVPPEPEPVQLRVLGALLAIALGLVLQLISFESFGNDRMLFGATTPLWQEPFRLVTASFLHGSLSHAFSNGAFGLLLGVVLFGTHRFGATAFVWLASSAVGLTVEVLMSPGANVIGASAGNYGLVGLWAMGQFQRAQTRWLVRREVMRTLGVLLLLLPGAITPFSANGTRIAVLAHVFGFLAGLFLGVYFRRRVGTERDERIDRRSRSWGLLALCLTVSAWASGFVTNLG